MFHHELHADGTSSPLVSDPDEFLATLRKSQVFQVLGATNSKPGLRTDGRPGQRDRVVSARSGRPGLRADRRHRLLVVPGSYPQHTQAIISDFTGRHDVDLRVLDPKGRDPRPRREQTLALIADRLSDATGRPHGTISERNASQLAWADTIFVGWCDNAAMWATIHAPPHARLVDRIHSIDALSAHPHMIDWSRVSDVIFVADHVRELVQRAVPAIANGPNIHVLPNAMTLDPFGKRKRSGANRTIALIGWAQRVKDPIWALEVLARLRVHDPDWKLLLLGSDFKTRSHLSELRYRDRFRARAQHDDVRDGITYAGYCRDLPEALRAAGFILSASRREAFPVGSTEGAASAAAPVIRNWPMYTAYDAPHRIYPSDWTVESPDDATNRILTYAEPQIQAEAGATQHAGSSSSTSTGPPSPRATSASSLALSSSLLPRCHYGRIHSPLGLALHRHRVLGMVLDGVCVICRAVWAASCGWPDLAFIGESLPGPCGHVALVGQAFTGVCLGVASVGQALKSVWRSGPAVQLERLKPIYPAGTLGTLGTPPRGELLAQEVCLVAQAPGGIAKCAGLPAQFDRVATNALGGGLQRVDSEDHRNWLPWSYGRPRSRPVSLSGVAGANAWRRYPVGPVVWTRDASADDCGLGTGLQRRPPGCDPAWLR